MGIDDMKEKGSDAAITKAGDAAEEKTGGKGASQIDKGEKIADEKIGE